MTTVQITTRLLDALQQKARAATPGPWEFWHGYVATDIDNDGGHVICDRPPRSGGKRQRIVDANFTHITAANPATILALVEHISSLTERLERAEKDAERWRFNRMKSLGGPELADAGIDAAIAQEKDHE